MESNRVENNSIHACNLAPDHTIFWTNDAFWDVVLEINSPSTLASDCSELSGADAPANADVSAAQFEDTLNARSKNFTDDVFERHLVARNMSALDKPNRSFMPLMSPHQEAWNKLTGGEPYPGPDMSDPPVSRFSTDTEETDRNSQLSMSPNQVFVSSHQEAWNKLTGGEPYPGRDMSDPPVSRFSTDTEETGKSSRETSDSILELYR